MLIETSGSNETHDEEKLNHFLEKQMASDTISDGVIVNEPSKIHVTYSIFKEKKCVKKLKENLC